MRSYFRRLMARTFRLRSTRTRLRMLTCVFIQAVDSSQPHITGMQKYEKCLENELFGSFSLPKTRFLQYEKDQPWIVA